MRTRASLVLSAVALGQVVILGVSLGFLVPRFRETRADLIRHGNAEQDFLNQLADAESDIYRTAILLRDEVSLDGKEQQRTHRELAALLTRMEDRPLMAPDWISPDMRILLEGVEKRRLEYLDLARMVSAWPEEDRLKFGPSYLSRQLVPLRESFITEERKIAALALSVRETHSKGIADSIQGIERLTVEIVLVAALLSLALAGVAVRRFRDYEKERDAHLEDLNVVQGDLRALSQRLVTSQELERKKLSRDLHDEVGQLLTALRVQVGQIEASEASAQHVALAAELAERSLRIIRDMARGLRPAMLDDLGLAPALKWLGRDFSKNTALDVEVVIEGECAGLDENTRICIFRVVQEALTNCVKYSGVSSARVLLQENPAEVVLTVQDRGRGLPPGSSRGIGLLGMRERVEELGGEFAVVASPETGTLIRAHLPKRTIEKL